MRSCLHGQANRQSCRTASDRYSRTYRLRQKWIVDFCSRNARPSRPLLKSQHSFFSSSLVKVFVCARLYAGSLVLPSWIHSRSRKIRKKGRWHLAATAICWPNQRKTYHALESFSEILLSHVRTRTRGLMLGSHDALDPGVLLTSGIFQRWISDAQACSIE